MQIIRAESPRESSPMADSTAATPGTSGGDMGMEYFFPARIGDCNLRRDPFKHLARAFYDRSQSLELDRRTALPWLDVILL